MIKERFDKSDRNLDKRKNHFNQPDETLGELVKMLRSINKRLAGLLHGA